VEQVEIRVRGQLDGSWSEWFSRLSMTHTEGGETVLAGPIRDQAELRGVLFRLADLGLSLISVTVEKRTPDNLVPAADRDYLPEHPRNDPKWR
jgi:hypothetical protein